MEPTDLRFRVGTSNVGFHRMDRWPWVEVGPKDGHLRRVELHLQEDINGSNASQQFGLLLKEKGKHYIGVLFAD